MPAQRTFFFEGLGVSRGIAIGPAYVIESTGYNTDSYRLAGDEEVDADVSRFRDAIERAAEELVAIREQVAQQIDRQQAAIFDAHLMMLQDPYLVDRTIEGIRKDRANAESVFWAVTRSLGEKMRSLGDDYFAERNHDLYDVARRVLKHLSRISAEKAPAMPREGCIIVATDLGPAETASFKRDRILGLATNEGGPTSHTAIMAKALALPAVVGLEYATHYIRTGDMVVLDGAEGKLILNPSPELLLHYRRRAEEFDTLRVALGELRALPAVTTDGERVALMANIEFPQELDALESNGAEGIGLFRSEYMFLERAALPTELEQAAEFLAAYEAMGDRPVVLRTLDIGGDKLPAEEYHAHEANPFLGLRAVRLCLERPELLRTQLRAMMSSSVGRVLNIMIPMVSGLEEIRAVRRMVDETLERRRQEGVACPREVRVGAMIEIPSAALLADTFAEECDFFSIGTNDLVQYTLAVDRINKSVAHLYRPTHPAVLQLLRMIVAAAQRRGIPVSVCGEMASDPRLAILLVGLGVRTLSMGPSSIGLVKRALRGVSMAEAESLAREVLSLPTAVDVDNRLQARLGPIIDRLGSPAAYASS